MSETGRYHTRQRVESSNIDMTWTWFVSIRYLLAKRRERFISIITLISVLGVSVGVAALIVVLSVMTGFDEEIKEKIIGTYSHVIILKNDGILDVDSVTNRIKDIEDVISFSPFIDQQAILKKADYAQGVLLRGVDEEKEATVTNVREFIKKGKLDFGGNGIILGSQIKKNLNISFGDTVTLISPRTRQAKDFVVKDVFDSGRYDYDSNMVLVSLRSAKDLFGDAISGIGVKVKNEFEARRVKNKIEDALGFSFAVRTWQDLDRNLLRALAVEKKMMFFILALIIIVACFNIASTLIMVVMEKTKDIGILKSVGATNSQIKSIFITNGFLIGFTGIIFGALAGFAIATYINQIAGFIEHFTGFSLFPSDVYYLSEIPVKIEAFDVASVLITALLISVIAALYPAWQASKLNPIEAIRYE